ncbi:hypothetical protein SY85_10695 [Flavisolibacter tropicus]|uniref:DUF6985 domain-containing protein n=2 Tax=Flavisolibacter tropicus TaxID=1492898 RepID=A0A172TUV4_9BACT|nr:hypothetical protein SY85_10695 [Flavisolibacter tropicus]
MSNVMNSIPNMQAENIGSKLKPLYMIKGFIELPCWNGYYLNDEAYKGREDRVITGGRIVQFVDGEIAPDKSLHFSAEQINAYTYLMKHQEDIKHSIVQGLKREFPRLLSDEYASWEQEAPHFPKLSEEREDFDFQDYIGPESISISEDSKDEVAYINWQFRCRWDIEHGFQVVTHKDRVIEIGPDVDIWNIYKDNGTYEQELKAYNDRVSVSCPRKQKKWWQFWW